MGWVGGGGGGGATKCCLGKNVVCIILPFSVVLHYTHYITKISP